MIGALVFFCALPVSVWLLANICAVIDEPNPIGATLRLVISCCLILVFLLVSSTSLWLPMAAAFGCVVVAHCVAYYVMFRRNLGVHIYQQTPPATPLLEDQQD